MQMHRPGKWSMDWLQSVMKFGPWTGPCPSLVTTTTTSCTTLLAAKDWHAIWASHNAKEEKTDFYPKAKDLTIIVKCFAFHGNSYGRSDFCHTEKPLQNNHPLNLIPPGYTTALKY